MLRIERNARVESVGEKVHLFRFNRADMVVTFWNWRTHVFIYLHPPAPLHETCESFHVLDQCPKCSGMTVVRAKWGARVHAYLIGIFQCRDCGLVYSVKNFTQVN